MSDQNPELQSDEIVWTAIILLVTAAIYAGGTAAIYSGGALTPDLAAGQVVPFRPMLPSWFSNARNIVPHYISSFAHWAWGIGSIVVAAIGVGLSLAVKSLRARFSHTKRDGL